jgi:hypothetical protein
MKHIKLYEDFTNEASTPGRAWSGALSNVDKLFAWMYDNGILSKSEKAEKDRIFSQYYRWYNDGDFPAALRSMGVSKGDSNAVIEKALEELVEKFMKEVLNKYTGKYDRKEFHIDTLLADLNTLENIVAGYKDPNGRGEPDPYGLLNYWGKKINTGNSDFEKLLGELGPLYKDVSDSTNKAFDAAGDKIGTSYTIAYRRELAKGKGIWTPELEKKYMKMKSHMLRMHEILKKVIEATQRARVAILDRQWINESSVNEKYWDLHLHRLKNQSTPNFKVGDTISNDHGFTKLKVVHIAPSGAFVLQNPDTNQFRVYPKGGLEKVTSATSATPAAVETSLDIAIQKANHLKESELNEGAEPKLEKLNHFIVLKGDDVEGNAQTFEKAVEIYNGLKPKQRLIDGREIYQLVWREK